MALVVKDRVQEVTTTTGTGTVTLAGAVTGFQTFAAIGDGNTCYYAITSGNDWEVGLGTYTSSGTTLSRDTILESSNAGSAITLSGTSNVFVTYPAEKSVFNDRTLTINGTSYDLSADRSWSVGIAWQSVQTSNFTASANSAYPVNTTSGSITVTLPASPSSGDIVTVVDYAGTALSNNIVINPNGNKINSSTSNVFIIANRQAANFVYIDSTQGWLSYADAYASATNPLPQLFSVDYLVVAGGGGGGRGYGGGGGGAGGYRLFTSQTLNSGISYTITVGAGGTGDTTNTRGVNGSNSVFNTTASTGGGGGAAAGTITGLNGGSGGGGASNGDAAGGTGISGQGNNGGNSAAGAVTHGGGGGGGAGAVGSNGATATGGGGGNGSSSSISGSSVTYAGGGGGGAESTTNTSGAGGTGGGGKGGYEGVAAIAGTANLGGGGGGGGGLSQGNGANGGSGVVIIKVPDTVTATFSAGVTQTSTTSGGFKYYTVTATSTTSETVTFS